MSFFNDFLDYFKIDDETDKTSILTFVGVGLVVMGNISIMNLSDTLVEIKSNRDKISIFGENLLIKSVSKGEIVIAGKVNKTEVEEKI